MTCSPQISMCINANVIFYYFLGKVKIPLHPELAERQACATEHPPRFL